MTSCSDAILARCSVRWFKPDPIPREALTRILEAALRAPTAHGAEQWFFVVVTSESKRRQLHRLLREAHEYYATRVPREPYSPEAVAKWVKRVDEGMYMAPAYVAAYLDMRRRVCKEEFTEYERLMAVQSLSAAIENMIIAAWEMGIGSVWLGVPLLAREEFDRVLEPPPGCELQAVVALGYPLETPKPRRRKPLEEVSKFV